MLLHTSSHQSSTSCLFLIKVRSKDLQLKIETSQSKIEGGSQRGLQSQSTASAAENHENHGDKYPESESQFGNNPKYSQNLLYGKEQSIDYKETADNKPQSVPPFKTFSFVSVVMEPSKKNPRSMKARDKNKPIIEQAIINKQIRFMKKLQEYQKQNLSPLPIEFDEMREAKDTKKKNKNEIVSQIIRGNLGFCYLDMSLINLCGIPSLWIDPREFATSGSKIAVGEKQYQFEPYIKPYQKNLMRKQFKIYCMLRFHKIFENEKYFGKNLNMMFNQGYINIMVDYWQFSTDNLKETNKFYIQQQKHVQKRQETFQEKSFNQYSESRTVLDIIQGSIDSIIVDIPRMVDPDPGFFKLINSEAKILKQILFSQNFQQTDQNNWNLLWTSVTLQQRPQIYEQLLDYQKINHFMNSVELTRKDRFAENIQNLKQKFGQSNFEFVPETYQFPDELPLFQQRYNQIKAKIKKQESNLEQSSDGLSKEDNLWIYKPSQSSQGKGIYIISELSDLNKELEKGVISKYVSNPLLVNHHKFDMRIYVLLTSVDPLRIYVYNEGLARFASSPYENSKNQIKNLYSHLTNYSINKKSESFSQNKSLDERDHGNKWSISDLQAHLEKLGINMQPIWERIYDAIIKAIISVEHHLLNGCKKIQHSSRSQNCFELFGFDIILDSKFRPYVLEVNFSPSLSADSPIDYHIKSNLLVDALNIVGLKKTYKKRATTQKNQGIQKLRQNLNNNSGVAGYLQMIQAHIKSKESVRQSQNQKIDYNSFSQFLAQGKVDQYFMDRLSRISAKHRELVFETLDEMQRNKNLNFTCIYPAAGCYQYDKYFEGGGRQSNQLIHRYLFTKNELFALTKQISDYQKQCIKTKYGEDFNSQSEEEYQQDQESSESGEQEQEEVEKPKPEPVKEVKISSPQPRVVKIQAEAPIILEKNEISESSSDEQSGSIKISNQPVQQKEVLKSEPLIPIKIENAQQVHSEQVVKETKEFESVESPTKISNILQPVKILTIESQSPTKITNLSQSNEIESPQKQEMKVVKEFKITKSVIEEKLKTPVPADSLPKITKPVVGIESKSSVHSPLDKNREISEPSVSYKSSMAKITITNQKPPVQKKEEIQLPQEHKNEPDQKPKSRNQKPQEFQAAQVQNNTVTSIHIKEEKKQPIATQTKSEIEQVKQSLTVQKEKSEEIKIDKPKTPPIIEVNLTTNQDTMVTLDKNQEKILDTQKKEQIEEKEKHNEEKGEEQRQEEEKPAEKKKQKMIITGDDILIEYVNRIIKHLDSIQIVFQKKYNQKVELVEDILPQQLKTTLEKFVLHSIWSTKLSTSQKSAPLAQKIRIRHKEMIDRRTKILTSMLKKNNSKITPQEIQEELQTQDNNRERIISRIQSQKIEKMVKQSNVENQIDIVSILVEGSYNLPIFLQVSGGKTVINGTLSSLKIFEKILKSDKIQNLQNNYLLLEQEKRQFIQHSPQKIKNNVEFLTETKPTRENSKLFVSSIMVNSSNTQLAYRPLQLQSANKAEKYHLPMIIGGVQPPPMNVHEKQQLNQTVNNVFPEAQKRRMTNSGSASGYKHPQIKNGLIAPLENTQTYNNSMVQTMVGINNSYIQTASSNVEDNKDALKYHSISEGPKPKISRQIMAAVHQKNTQSFISSQNQSYQGEQPDYQKQHSFDKRQRSYRNDNQMLSMTYNKNNPEQMMQLHKEINEKIRLQNNGFQRMNPVQPNYTNMHDTELNLNQVKNVSSDIGVGKSAYVNQTFSPQSNNGPNPKVSNSAISIVKAGEHLISNNQSFVEFNRSHQGEGFFKKLHHRKTENFDANATNIQVGSITSHGVTNIQVEGQSSIKQQEGKRGSSHSHQAGGGNRRASFKINTGTYNNIVNPGKEAI